MTESDLIQIVRDIARRSRCGYLAYDPSREDTARLLTIVRTRGIEVHPVDGSRIFYDSIRTAANNPAQLAKTILILSIGEETKEMIYAFLSGKPNIDPVIFKELKGSIAADAITLEVATGAA